MGTIPMIHSLWTAGAYEGSRFRARLALKSGSDLRKYGNLTMVDDLFVLLIGLCMAFLISYPLAQSAMESLRRHRKKRARF